MRTAGKPDPRVVKSRETILSAARTLLQESGPAAVTHQRVAARAGVGRATVYRHWRTPELLLSASLQRGEDGRMHQADDGRIVVGGEARVVNGERSYTLRPNESTFIPVETRHRLENAGTEPLLMIEVQCGDYLGEDDIVRFDDKYGRVAS